MSQAIRQSNIFAGEDWTVLYRAFSSIDFTSYDPPAITAALRQYLKQNYPESFNDWIASSEKVAVIELLGWLAGSLSFRIDLNTRENFLETATSRESILRLAKFLSYIPRRGQSGRGLLKVTQIKTSESIIDAGGENLNNKVINWNDPDNADWLEQFEAVLNCAIPSTNKLGIPSLKTKLSDITTELYPLNSLENANCVFKFNTVIDNKQENFEIVNTTFDETGFKEVTPDPQNKFNIVYRLDGKGYGSTRSGFFMMFKQGELKSQNTQLTTYEENRVIKVVTNNISETDVWIQSLNDDTTVKSNWTKVPAISGENMSFTSLSSDLRNIYTVNTETGDSIGVRFGDGRFGNIPFGKLKIWFRTINNKQYNIKPKDIEDIQIVIPYNDKHSRQQTLTLTLSLQEEITNAIGSETIEQIRFRAPQVYSTQNRMVSGEDYNLFPLSTNEIIKSKAVNRIYSGQSRYLELIDPTATYQDVVAFCDDGVVYKRNRQYYTQVPLVANFTTEQLIKQKLIHYLEQPAVRNYIKDKSLVKFTNTEKPIWNASAEVSTTKGKFTNVYGVLSFADIEYLKTVLHAGASLCFEYLDVNSNSTKTKWVTVMQTNVTYSSFVSEIVSEYTWFSDNIPTGAVLIKAIPKYRTSFLDKPTLVYTNTSEMELIQASIAAKNSFSLYYVPSQVSVMLEDNSNVPGKWEISTASQYNAYTGYVLINMNYKQNDHWEITTTADGYEYIFFSEKAVRFANTSNSKKLDGTLNAEVNDQISVISGPGQELVLDIVDNLRFTDGTLDATSVIVTPHINNNVGGYTNPFAIEELLEIYKANKTYAIYSQTTYNGIYETVEAKNVLVLNKKEDIPTPTTYTEVYEISTNLFWKYFPKDTWYYTWPGGWIILGGKIGSYIAREITKSINYKWRHYADLNSRINPAITNIIDMFVLTAEYDYNVRTWIKEGMTTDVPMPPDSYTLKNQFAQLENYKMFSDELIWRSVSYKYLFGTPAKSEHQCKFNVVKLPSATLSDGEIKSKIIEAINEFFDVNKWDFGETFYFTELAAYIHFKLSTYISSIVLVPLNSDSKFGNMFEIACDPNEMFISTATVNDIHFVTNLTNSNMRID